MIAMVAVVAFVAVVSVVAVASAVAVAVMAVVASVSRRGGDMFALLSGPILLEEASRAVFVPLCRLDDAWGCGNTLEL
jgi:hypothetical protein